MTTRAQRTTTWKPAAVDYPRVEVPTRAALRRWLAAHHASSKGIWVVTRKRSAGGKVA